MSIKIIREPRDLLETEPEVCFYCNKVTRYWHATKDVPLCYNCSKRMEEKDIPTKKEWIENHNKIEEGGLKRFFENISGRKI